MRLPPSRPAVRAASRARPALALLALPAGALALQRPHGLAPADLACLLACLLGLGYAGHAYLGFCAGVLARHRAVQRRRRAP
jgi:hypothetical protein